MLKHFTYTKLLVSHPHPPLVFVATTLYFIDKGRQVKFAEFVQLGGQSMRFIAYYFKTFIAKKKTRPPAPDSSKIPDEKLIINNFTWPYLELLLMFH